MDIKYMSAGMSMYAYMHVCVYVPVCLITHSIARETQMLKPESLKRFVENITRGCRVSGTERQRVWAWTRRPRDAKGLPGVASLVTSSQVSTGRRSFLHGTNTLRRNFPID